MKVIEKIQWFALGMAATVIIVAAYCLMQNGSENNNGNEDNVVYEDSAARCAIYGQVMIEDCDTNAAPLLTKEQVRAMYSKFLHGVIDSTRYDVDKVVDIFVRESYDDINDLISALYTPEQLQIIRELYKDLDIDAMSESIMTSMQSIERKFSNPELTRELESCRR